jgi:mono/diheme cytochrome c family protein
MHLTFKLTTSILLPALWWATTAAADPPKAAKPPAATKEVVEKGRAVFMTNCVPCHGEKGDGTGPVGLTLTPRPRDFGKDTFKQGTAPEQIFKTISEGVPGTMMVAWPQLTEEERWAAAHFVTTMIPKAAAAPAKAKK